MQDASLIERMYRWTASLTQSWTQRGTNTDDNDTTDPANQPTETHRSTLTTCRHLKCCENCSHTASDPPSHQDRKRALQFPVTSVLVPSQTGLTQWRTSKHSNACFRRLTPSSTVCSNGPRLTTRRRDSSTIVTLRSIGRVSGSVGIKRVGCVCAAADRSCTDSFRTL
jgi:hypothetical protein